MGAIAGGGWSSSMPVTFDSVVSDYLRSGNPAQRTREEYATTVKKWARWGHGVPLGQLGRREIREFLDWVHNDAAAQQGTNPGRTANKVRSHLRAVFSWAWEQDMLDALPRFPKVKPQRDIAGRHYLTKTDKAFYRPMNRTVHAHIRSIMPNAPDPNSPVFFGGGTRPNNRCRALSRLAAIGPKADVETGQEQPWVLKDLRKTCATYYDEHVPESSVEILGHSAGGITYRHYAHRAPLAFRAIMTLPPPTAFSALANGFDGRCPCCGTRFADTDKYS